MHPTRQSSIVSFLSTLKQKITSTVRSLFLSFILSSKSPSAPSLSLFLPFFLSFLSRGKISSFFHFLVVSVGIVLLPLPQMKRAEESCVCCCCCVQHCNTHRHWQQYSNTEGTNSDFFSLSFFEYVSFQVPTTVSQCHVFLFLFFLFLPFFVLFSTEDDVKQQNNIGLGMERKKREKDVREKTFEKCNRFISYYLQSKLKFFHPFFPPSFSIFHIKNILIFLENCSKNSKQMSSLSSV